MTNDEKKLQARQLLVAMLAIGAMKPDGKPEYSSELEWPHQNDPCKGCSSNPKNGGSGICYCTLGLAQVKC